MNNSKTILFLCTGNFFRSRFAEYYFNHFAKDLPWKAVSRGLALDTYTNVGPISGYTMQELEKLNISVKNPRSPLSATKDDFEQADKIICLSKTEHEPMIVRMFPKWAGAVTYWNIGDIDVESTKSSFEKMRDLLDRLIADLRRSD